MAGIKAGSMRACRRFVAEDVRKIDADFERCRGAGGRVQPAFDPNAG